MYHINEINFPIIAMYVGVITRVEYVEDTFHLDYRILRTRSKLAGVVLRRRFRYLVRAKLFAVYAIESRNNYIERGRD